jgi:hypothetical protein
VREQTSAGQFKRGVTAPVSGKDRACSEGPRLWSQDWYLELAAEYEAKAISLAGEGEMILSCNARREADRALERAVDVS